MSLFYWPMDLTTNSERQVRFVYVMLDDTYRQNYCGKELTCIRSGVQES